MIWICTETTEAVSGRGELFLRIKKYDVLQDQKSVLSRNTTVF